MPRAFVLPKQGVRQSTDSYAKSQLQQAVQQSQTQANAIPWANGKLFTNVAVNSLATARVYHGLGRTPAGWIIVRALGVAAVAPQNAAAVTSEHIDFFNPTAVSATIDVWVY